MLGTCSFLVFSVQAQMQLGTEQNTLKSKAGGLLLGVRLSKFELTWSTNSLPPFPDSGDFPTPSRPYKLLSSGINSCNSLL